MKKLYLFNPDHDLALANNSTNYVAPLSARQFAEDLSCLPLWYAESGSKVLTSNENRMWKIQMEVLFPPLKTIDFTKKLTEEELSPWGWNPALKKYSDSISDAFLKDVYCHSHRRWSSLAMAFLRNKVSFSVPISAVELHGQQDVDDFVNMHHNVMLKAPVSGSGRGVWRCFGELSESAKGWCKRTLIKQKSVMGEPLYDKVQDFAMEFFLKNGRASFVGYSLFKTEAMGVYSENILASDQEIERVLTEKIPLNNLFEVRDALLSFFEKEYSFYEGFLGVDMLIYKENNRFLLNPMIEINLRMTMGVVARIFFDEFVSQSSKGIFKIEYFKSTDELQHNHQIMQTNYPLQVLNNRIHSGYVSLCPINNKTHYRVSVKID